MEKGNVTDLYEAAYLVLAGCILEEVSCVMASEALVCGMRFSGPRLERAREEFRAKKASANLHAFRSAYHEVNGYLHEAKKSYDRERRRMRREGGEG